MMMMGQTNNNEKHKEQHNKVMQSEYQHVIMHILVAVWLSGNVVGRINEVTLRQAGLVLRWVTVRGYTVLVFNKATQANSAWPSLHG